MVKQKERTRGQNVNRWWEGKKRSCFYFFCFFRSSHLFVNETITGLSVRSGQRMERKRRQGIRPLTAETSRTDDLVDLTHFIGHNNPFDVSDKVPHTGDEALVLT